MSSLISSAVRRLAQALAAAAGLGLVGYANGGTQVTAEKALDILYYGVHNVMNPKFAGGTIPGTAGSSQLAIQAAVDYAIANGGVVFVPPGMYNVDMIQIKDAVYRVHFEGNGATFVGVATDDRAGVFDVVNCVDFTIAGCRIHGNDNGHYDMGLCIRAMAGTSQATTRITVSDVVVRNAKIGFGVGRYDADYQCSEINFFSCNTFKCPGGAYVGGSQSGACFNGCNLVSEKNAAFVGAPDRVIWLEGGFVTVVGGELAFAETANAVAILLNPCSSATYGNLYPILRLTGAHIETQSQLIALLNNRALAAPDSRASNIAIQNCGGYVSGNAAAQDFIYLGDASYVGALSVKQCNFYSDVARTAYNVSAAGVGARISVDQESFGRNFKHWLGGIYGGTVAHGMMPLVSVTGVGDTLAAGERLCKFVNINTSGVFARHGVWYGDGVFVSKNGLKTLRFVATIVGAATTGDIYVRKGGAGGPIVGFGRYTGIGTIEAVVRGVVDGDTFGLYVDGAAPNTFDAGEYNQMDIYGSTDE